MANTNRNKGHQAEREYANKFKELGYEDCITSRYGSRIHDDCGVDLINLPFNVQIKAGFQRGMKPSSVIKSMKKLVAEKLSKEVDNPFILIHKKQGKKGKRRVETDEMVSMTFSDFVKLLKKEY